MEVKLLEVNGRDATANEAMNMGATWVVLDKYVPRLTTSVQYASVSVVDLIKWCEPQRARPGGFTKGYLFPRIE